VNIVMTPLHEVVRWPRNPKDHDLGALHLSFNRFGFISPLIRDERTGRLIVGHGRLDALLDRFQRGEPPPRNVELRTDGEWLIPVIRGVEFANESEAAAYLVADNRLTEIGGWDDAKLIDMLQALKDGPGLTGTGYDDDDLQKLLDDAGSELLRDSGGREVRCPRCGETFIPGAG